MMLRVPLCDLAPQHDAIAFETNEVGGAVSEIRRKDLDGRRPIERRIYDLVNSALSTFTDLFDDTIMEEELPDHRRMGITAAKSWRIIAD